jgi:hypothetical protein
MYVSRCMMQVLGRYRPNDAVSQGQTPAIVCTLRHHKLAPVRRNAPRSDATHRDHPVLLL